MVRHSGTYQATVGRGVISWTLFIVGFLAAFAGVFFGSIELYHSTVHRHDPIWGNIIGCSVCLLGGLQLIQTGNVQETIDVVKEVVASRIPGGKRKNDPPLPPDDGHQEG